MSSLRSQFHHSRQQHEQQQHQSSNPSQTSQKQFSSTRIPTKPVSAESGKPGKAVQHVSKLAKRSKSVKSSESSSKSSTTRTATPVTAVAQNTIGTSRGISVAPSGVTASSAPPNMRTPSLVSGSSVSTYDSPRSVLRRKPSGAIDRYAAQKRAASAGGGELERVRSQSRNESSREMFDNTVLGICMPSTRAHVEFRSPFELSQQAYDIKDYPPPVPAIYAPSATPSTRYADSPFSHVPTPSSASSYSPGLVATSGTANRSLRSTSPTRRRPPPSGRTPSRDQASKLGLPPVRESSTSSSNSAARTQIRLVQGRSEPPEQPPEIPLRRRPTDASKPTPRSMQSTDAQVASPNRKPPQVPPELAHLNVDPFPPPNTTTHKSPPPRPIRDDTTTLPDMSRPVIQSDLPRLYTTYHKRTPSQETPGSSSSSNVKSRFGFSSRSSSRNESPRIDSAISPPPTAKSLQRGTSPKVVQSADGNKLRRKDSPAIGAPSPGKTSKFGLFSRKPKTEPQANIEKPKRQPSKGPMAGTGHEAYGRFGLRGRSGSISSNNGGFRSPSTDSGSSHAPRSVPPPPSLRKGSTGSQAGSELDDFLRERLNPVILRGSGSTGGRTGSSSDLPGCSYQQAPSHSSSPDGYAHPHLLPSAIQDHYTGSPVKRPSLGGRELSESSEDDVPTRRSNLATRRSLTRVSSVDSRSPVRVPLPINTNLPMQKNAIGSYDTETSAWPRTDDTLPPERELLQHEGLWLRSPTHSESTIKSPRKWNFFQRITSSPLSKGKQKAVEPREVPEFAAHQSPYRGVAHYAMPDSVEPIGLSEVERIAQEYDTSAEDSLSEWDGPSKMVPYERRHTSMLPSPPRREYSSDSDFRVRPKPPRINVERQDSSESPEVLRAQAAFKPQAANMVDIPRSPADGYSSSLAIPQDDTSYERHAKVTTREPASQESIGTPEQPNDSPRQPRLSPVGRIPAVVSRRDRDRKLSDNSFSRPFARAQPRPSVKAPLRPGSVYNQIRDMASPIEAGSQPVSSSSTHSDVEPRTSSYCTDPPSDSTNRTSMGIHNQLEFFSLQPRKGSEQSYQSSSSGNPSWPAPLFSQPPQQEDIWHEYNDFMDQMGPLKTPTTGSSLGAPFQYSSMLFEGNNYSFPTPSLRSQPPSVGLPPIPGQTQENLGPTVLTVPQQISKFLQPSMSPITPDTISGLVDGYGTRSTSTLFSQNAHQRASMQASVHDAARDSVASSSYYSRGSSHSRSASVPGPNARLSETSSTPTARGNRATPLMEIAEIPPTPSDTKASSSLRFGALMTSKWLSFGRVLFSPAHNEVQLASESKVLVVDGLSSDWSYYVALSYPQAQVYNLSMNLPSSPSFSWPADDDVKPPPNHHQLRLANIETSFPFPKGFFNAIVFRFPTATTEHAYAACLSECKRVLRPGGFLEVAMLDLDLMNMGTRARKAVRDLKTRMQLRDQEVCLRNLSDIFVRLIGRRGFESVQRCIVGVPAAGRIPRSQDMSSISSDSETGRPFWQREAKHSKSQEFSLSNLLEDTRRASEDGFAPDKSNSDENITKMAAKVGRWWYSTCYEKALLPQERSIWKGDPGLLRECEKQGTSFRLLICHAQKPAQVRRRTQSC